MGRCLDEIEVEQLAAGALGSEARDIANAHLADCDACRHAIERLQNDADLLGEIQEAFRAAGGGEWEAEAPEQRSTTAIASQPDAIEGYEILAELHRGGQGVVYKAVQKATKRTVALKILLRGASATERQRQRFEREIELVAGLSHPNIVTIYDSGVSRGRQFYAMEFVDGVPLDQFMAKNSMASTSRPANARADAAVRLFHRICSAVSYAHQRGVIHRDLKPANILINAAGEPHILDFGLAKLADANLADAQLTASGEFLGTLAYASPEQAHGDPQAIDVRTDVYSLGVILFEMLTGEYPYPVSGSLSAVLGHIADVEPRRPSGIRHDIDGEIETIVLKALAKQPERRYQSAEHLTRDLSHYLHGEPIDAKRDSTWYLLRKSMRRYRAVMTTVASFLAVIIAALVVSIFLWRRAVADRDLAQQAQTNEKSARIAEEDARRAEQAQREEAEYQSYTANIAAAGGALRMHDVFEAAQRLDAAPARWRGWEWRQLWNRLDDCRHTFMGHTSYVSDVAISPDGQLVASASRKDHTVNLWDATSHKLIRSFSDLPWPAIAFRLDGSELAVATNLGIVELWNIASGEYLTKLSGPTCYLDVIKFSPDGRLLAAGVHELNGATGKHALLLWRLSDGELLHEIPQTTWQISDLAFSPDGQSVAIVRFDGVTVWNTSTGEMLHRLSDLPGNELCVAFSRDGRSIASGASDDVIHVRDVESGRELRALTGHTGAITSVAFGKGDEHIVSGSRDKTIRIWKVATGESTRVLAGHRWNISSVAMSGDGRSIVSGAWDAMVKLWDGLDGSPRDLLAGHTALVASVAFSPDGRLLATASWDHTARLWDLEQRKELATLTGHGVQVHGVAFSPDGTLLATSGWKGTLKLWDLASRRELASLHGHAPDSRVHAVAFAPSGAWLVSGSSDDTLRIWDVKTHQQLAVLTGHSHNKDHIHSVAISPDGKWIASAGHYTVKVWDADQHVETASFPRQMVQDDYSLAFHPDSRRLAAGSDVREITMWDVIDRQPMRVFEGHTDGIHAVAISPDGQRLVSAAFDNRVKVWDLASGREVAMLTGHLSHANTIAFSPNGRYLVAGLQNGGIQIWDGGDHSPLTNSPLTSPTAENASSSESSK